MNHFFTQVDLPSFPWNINHKHSLLLMGSCFADEIGAQFKENKFDTLVNPFGTLFNPLSVFQHLIHALSSEPLNPEKWVVYKGLHFHYDLHSSIFHKEKNDLVSQYQSLQKQVKHYLNGDYIFITLGTAWVYEWVATGETVANCHKQGSRLFRKNLLSPDQILTSFEDCYQLLKSNNPNLKFIFTVSPVRHIKDTLSLNAVSKATLRLSAHQICTQFEDCYYFPSYEIVLDELRDYRFYSPDLLHPNEVAVKHIWNKLGTVIFEKETIGINEKWQKISRSLAHIPLHPDTVEYQNHLLHTLKSLEDLEELLPVEEEIAKLSQKIKNMKDKE
jgi:lysophospholipase L1-like esterase